MFAPFGTPNATNKLQKTPKSTHQNKQKKRPQNDPKRALPRALKGGKPGLAGERKAKIPKKNKQKDKIMRNKSETSEHMKMKPEFEF